jgi:putative hydrolase of the HAD superfamily
LRPDLKADLSGLRRESIRLALTRAGDDPALAEPAFDEFFAARQRVELFDDALPALQFLSQRWPVVALSNGNANVHVVGIGEHFRASLSASGAGMAKPETRFFRPQRMRPAWPPSMCCTSATMRSWMPGAPWMRVCTQSGSTAGR